MRRPSRLAVVVLCGALGAGSLAGCETTQEKASAQRAESERILEARAKRQAKRHGAKSQIERADGTKGQTRTDESARRHPQADKAAHEKGEG